MLNFSEACERNKQPISDSLSAYLVSQNTILEIGSGSGQHALFLSAQHHLKWQPSDQECYLDALTTNIKQYASPGVLPPIALDVRQAWPKTHYDGVFTANTLHIMSWKEVESFFKGVGTVLQKHGYLFIYGPFRYEGTFTSPSNAQFDRYLKARDSTSGIRDFEAINKLANAQGMSLANDLKMPANNQLLVWRR